MLKPSGSSSPAGEGGLPIGRELLQDAVDPGCTYVCAVGRHPAPRGHSRGHQAHRGHTPRAHPESAPREGAAEWWTLCKTEGDFPGKGGLTLERLWEDGEGWSFVGICSVLSTVPSIMVASAVSSHNEAGSSTFTLQMRIWRHELVKSQDLNAGGSNHKASSPSGVPPLGRGWAHGTARGIPIARLQGRPSPASAQPPGTAIPSRSVSHSVIR